MKYTTGIRLALLFCSLQITGISCSNNQDEKGAQASITRNAGGGMVDFVAASNAVIPAVVHIKTRFGAAGAGSGDPAGQLFGVPAPGGIIVMGSGSGVTLSADGYIVTNNHVVENASAIEVIFPDRRAFPARLVGTDPNTDLALLKVEATRLPVVKTGNSDAVQVGEWVLAIGYPLSLNSTVTAGIISAKGRSIGIINRSGNNSFGGNEGRGGNTAIESFLQTDAAINPGNSGGALVNINGELVGINTAIASQTGSYAGYAFAIPVNLVTKIIDDLKKYGEVKRAVLGVSFPSPIVEEEYLKQQGLNPGEVKGVYIIDVQEGSAAAVAGLKGGDIIQSIDGVTLSSSEEFSERIARHRPGDKITITYLRDGKSGTATVTLKGEETIKKTQTLAEVYNKLGAAFAPLTSELKQRLNIGSGVVVTDVRRGGFFDRLGIPSGTIIVIINGRPINTPEDINNAFLSAQRGLIQMLAIAPDGSRVAFNFSLGT